MRRKRVISVRSGSWHVWGRIEGTIESGLLESAFRPTVRDAKPFGSEKVLFPAHAASLFVLLRQANVSDAGMAA